VTYADDLMILCKKGKADEALQQLRKIMSKLKLGRHEPCMPGESTEMVGSGVRNWSNFVTGYGSVERLGEHEPSPLRRMAN
jgi:hypothetical protein